MEKDEGARKDRHDAYERKFELNRVSDSLLHLPGRTHIKKQQLPVQSSSMGICRSSCANTSSLEYYDAWGHQPIRRPYRPKDGAKLWTCERGCCSIRWKLDYAEFQNYFKYVEVSPYVVMQDKTQQCDCVMCRGVADASPPQRRWKAPLGLQKDSNSPTDGSLTDDEPERPESP